jgi:hypothetical protein
VSPRLAPGLEARAEALRARLGEVMDRGGCARLAEDEFDELALQVFRYQVDAVPPYGAYVRARSPGWKEVDRWSRIPPVPARAFRELPLVAGDPADVATVFRTSGTTGGRRSRGEHRVRDPSLYHASLLAAARAHLAPPSMGPEGGPLRVAALLPDPSTRSDSSLVHMAGVMAREWDPEGGVFLADPEWRLDPALLWEALERLAEEGVPVLVLGTAFAFVHLVDLAAGDDRSVSLPPRSRVMETGGFKGRSRRVSREELYGGISRVLGVPPGRIVNEYGMTELLSQFYEPVLREGERAPGGQRLADRYLVGPPWVRTRILDPESLDPVEPGRPGLLCHLDLANLHSVSAVLTEDLGVAAGDGFRVLGRIPGAEPRGCSLTMEELLRAREGLAS